ncbi:HIT-like protein [Fomitopsis betulina]|nr:HIT-like protein [Fomitopsis betulina]
MSSLFFSTFEVTRQAFYRNSLAYAIVNLKPLVPGHVLVVPKRPVQRLSELDEKELTSLMLSVNHVGKVIEKAYAADGLTIACQDGKAAGQTVPHVHFHLLPRKLLADRFTNNDDVYPAIEKAEANLQAAEPLKVDADEDRKPRTSEEMEREADWLREVFAKYKDQEPQVD